MNKKFSSNWRIELIEICKILKENGVDIQSFPNSKIGINGKREYITMKDLSSSEIDIERLIEEKGINKDFPIGYYIRRYKLLYNGTIGSLTQEQREEAERLGIVVKRNLNASKPVFKGRKISQFHLDFLNGILDKILSGQINTLEALELLKQACIENNETVLEDSGSIRRCVRILLKDSPEKLEAYLVQVKSNTGRRSPYKGKIGKPKLGLYHEKELQFKKKIIEHYLPLIISGETTIDIIQAELSTSRITIDKIIEDYYKENDNPEGIEEYHNAKRRNSGTSLEKRKNAKALRNGIVDYNIVTNKEFVFLNPEEQEKQLVMKINLDRLKEEQSETSAKRRNAVISEQAIRNRIDIIMDFFKKKNNPESNTSYFSDNDIRYMIFRYPTLINRTVETLEEKIGVLTSCDEIDEETAYGMIKTFPAIIGYEASRTKQQLDLLAKENLVDAVVSVPRRFMLSVDLMYALIQYAKERHHTLDLSEINRSNIFTSNAILKRVYGTSNEEIKAKYPYSFAENQDKKYVISPKELARSTYRVDDKTLAEADDILSRVINEPTRGVEE